MFITRLSIFPTYKSSALFGTKPLKYEQEEKLGGRLDGRSLLVMEMIEVTDAAAEVLRKNMVEGSVVRMILVATDVTGADYVLAWGDPLDDDAVFENNGIEVHMSPEDANLHGDSETTIDYVDIEDLGEGFIIHGPEEDACACDLDCHACDLDCHH